MNLNPTPDRAGDADRARTDGNPVPGWARVLAVVLVFGGYGLLEAHDAATERAIAASTATHVADATP